MLRKSKRIGDKDSSETSQNKYPGIKARIVLDNGSQFVTIDFKEFVSISSVGHAGMYHGVALISSLKNIVRERTTIFFNLCLDTCVDPACRIRF